MKKLSLTSLVFASLLLLAIGILVAGCGGAPAATDAQSTEPTQPDEPTSPAEQTTPVESELQGDPVRGGLLYDKWWAVIAEADEHAEEEGEEDAEDEHDESAGAPEGDHPLWATQTTNARSGEDTWRCKECHGWDYKGAEGAYGSGSHFTGFIGVYDSREKPASEVLASLMGSTKPEHDFSTVLEEQDLVDLTLFITQALIDTDELANADKSSKGDATAGKVLYEKVCNNCHGPEGNAINFASLDEPEFLGHLAPDNPWEFIHKVRFGQPGWPMPAAISTGWTNEDVADVLAYVQGFSSEAALGGGGQLYDKWWSVLGLEEPTGDHPLWATQTTNTRSGTDTWRCKECHGWDYKGAEGAYASGSHFTGFTGILSSSSLSEEELLGWLDGTANADHDFSSLMEDFALSALVAFMKNEASDISPYISTEGVVTGDPASGRELYEGTCASCHGVDGKKMNFGSPDEPEYTGTIAADNPWEFFHKASFGHPGVPMPSGRALGWTLEQIADVLAYAQTLPTE